MTWTRVSDDHFDRPEVLRLSRSASLLHIEALAWCNRVLSNGVFPRDALRRVTTSTDPESDAAELVSGGIWTATEDGWQIEWTQQRSRKAVLAEREYNTNRKAALRLHYRGEHSMCAAYVKHCRAVSHSGTPQWDATAESTAVSHVPIPSLPVPKGLGRVKGLGGSDGSTAQTPNGVRRSPTSRRGKGDPVSPGELIVSAGTGRSFTLTTNAARDEHVVIDLAPRDDDGSETDADLLRWLVASLTPELNDAKRLHDCPKHKGNRLSCKAAVYGRGLESRTWVEPDEETTEQEADELNAAPQEAPSVTFTVPAEFSQVWSDAIVWDLAHATTKETR